MKRILILVFSMLIVSVISINFINASSQNLSKIVKSSYDSSTKQLYIWGANHSGNLGTGDYKDVSEEDKIKVNDLIGKQKIIDYAITDAQTYVLTDSNKVYASGYNIGNGKGDVKNNKFFEIKFYLQKSTPITELTVISNINGGECQRNIGYSDKCNTDIKFLTNNNRIYSYFYGLNYVPTTPGITNWAEFFLHYDYMYGIINFNYPVFHNKSNGYETSVVVNSNGKLIQKYVVNKKARKFYKYLYNNGQLTYSRSYSDYKDKIRYYKDGKQYKGRVHYYKLRSDKARRKTKEYIYYYKNDKLISRELNEKINKTMVLKQKKYYYANRKNQLKSNSNGKARTYVTYYKNKKAYLTYRYDYNKSGKMINKTKVKIKTRY